MQAGGKEFDPPHLHQATIKVENYEYRIKTKNDKFYLKQAMLRGFNSKLIVMVVRKHKTEH